MGKVKLLSLEARRFCCFCAVPSRWGEGAFLVRVPTVRAGCAGGSESCSRTGSCRWILALSFKT